MLDSWCPVCCNRINGHGEESVDVAHMTKDQLELVGEFLNLSSSIENHSCLPSEMKLEKLKEARALFESQLNTKRAERDAAFARAMETRLNHFEAA